MQYIKESTLTKVRLGPAVDPSDGVTAVTSLTLSGADEAELLKSGGAATVDISGRTFAAIAGCSGWYDLTLTTGDTDTLGMATVVIQDADVTLPLFADFEVLPANVYDSLVGGTDKLQSDLVEVAGGTVTGTADLKASVTGLSTFDAASETVNIGKVAGNTVTGTSDFKANVSGLSTFSVDDILDDNGTDSFTWKEALRLIFAFLLGERSGGGVAGAKTFKLPGGTKTRVLMPTDENGNSSTTHTLDGSDS